MAIHSYSSLAGKRIFVTGHNGMLGSSISRVLRSNNLIVLTEDRGKLDLTRQVDVENWVLANKPDVIIISAAKVGGIHSNNTYPADFIYQNLCIQTNLIHAAHLAGVNRVIMIGSSCSYPKLVKQPINESSLLDGKPELTNQWYSVAKISGMKMCEAYRKQYGYDYISIIPTNLYGPGDNFDPLNSHVIPGLIHRFHLAKLSHQPSVSIWGSGSPLREFMYVDDASHAILSLMEKYSSSEPINIGTGQEISIKSLCLRIAKVVDYNGSLNFDPSKPDGAERKLLDSTKFLSNCGASFISLDDGLLNTYEWYKENVT